MNRHPPRPDPREEFELDQHARITAWFALGGHGGIVDLSIAHTRKGPWGGGTYRELPVAVARAIAACLHRPPPDATLGRAAVLVTDRYGNPIGTPDPPPPWPLIDELGAVAAIYAAVPDATPQSCFDAMFRLQGVVMAQPLAAVNTPMLLAALLRGDGEFEVRCLRAGLLMQLGIDTADREMRSRAWSLAQSEAFTFRPALTERMALSVAASPLWPYRESVPARIAVARDLLAALPPVEDDDDTGLTGDVPDDLSGLGGAP